jgi:uncharacterized protein YgbK (DUF1537 family)
MSLRFRRPASELSTSEHLTAALKQLRVQLRRAAVGQPPTPDELALLATMADQMRSLAGTEGLDQSLRAELEGVAQVADWLREPPEPPGPIVDLGGGV